MMKTRFFVVACYLTLVATSAAARDHWADNDPHHRQPHFFRRDLPSPQPTHAPQRIVSLAPVVTETLFAIGAGDRVVGVTRFCDRPAAVTHLPKVGGYTDPQLEAILQLHPDLVIAMPSMGQRTTLTRLREAQIPVYIVFGDSIAEIKTMMDGIGSVTHNQTDAVRLVRELEHRLADISASVSTGASAPRVVIAFQAQPLVLAGPHTFPAEALSIAGGKSIVPSNAPSWPTWSLEALLFLRPDVIVVASGASDAKRLTRMLAALPNTQMPEVRSTDQPILMRPGPHLADDVMRLAELIHDDNRIRQSPSRALPPTAPTSSPEIRASPRGDSP